MACACVKNDNALQLFNEAVIDILYSCQLSML